jgi:histo-blood group ABO system transferase
VAVALVTVVSGDAYERYAREMFCSAHEFFHPDPVVAHITLPGRPGWPGATLYRYHTLLEHREVFAGFSHVFLIDADMRFEAPVGPEVLGDTVATLHPGYVGKHPSQLPFERNPGSAAHAVGVQYFCGGFVGGTLFGMSALAVTIAKGIDADDHRRIVACWHDESHLNRHLAAFPPALVLKPSYCYPDNDAAYRTWWPEKYQRKIVAIDKTPEERGGR